MESDRFTDMVLEPVGPIPPRYSPAMEGPGRWCTTRWGYLWTNDDDAAGILPLDRADDATTAGHAIMAVAFAGMAAAGLSARAAYEALRDSLRRDGAATGQERAGRLEDLYDGRVPGPTADTEQY